MRVERRQAHPVLSKIGHATPILLVPMVLMVTGVYPKSNLFWTEDTVRLVSSTSIERAHSHCNTPHIADADALRRVPIGFPEGTISLAASTPLDVAYGLHSSYDMHNDEPGRRPPKCHRSGSYLPSGDFNSVLYPRFRPDFHQNCFKQSFSTASMHLCSIRSTQLETTDLHFTPSTLR